MADNKAQQNIQETAASLKAGQAAAAQTAANQQEVNQAFKESINLLNKMNKLIDDSRAKTSSFQKDTINVKKIQQEQERILRKQKSLEADISRARPQDLAAANAYIAKLRNREKLEKDLVAASGASKLNLQNQLSTLNQNIQRQEAQLANSTEQLDLVSKIESASGLKERVAMLGDELELEKDIAKQVGFTGKLLSFSSKYLGIGKTLQSKIVEETRKGTSTTKIWVDALGISSITLFGIGKLLKSAFDYIVGIQDQTVKFARAMNLSTGEARKVKMEFASLSVSSGDLFITSQKMVESQMELTDALGVTNVLSKEILATNIKLKDIAGIDAETRSAIAASSTITGKSAESTTKAVLSQVAGLKQATGLGFQYQKILKEAASFSGVLGLQFAKYPEKLTKSLVTVKAMGLELSKLDGMADSFLDFESSISKEFEAQLLTGKDINLAKAREAFLNNDLATAAAEITKQTGNANEFLKMNRIQQDAIAGAMGLSRSEMADMLKQQELFTKLGAKDLKDAQAKVQALKAQGKTREEIAALTGEEAYQSLVNASAQEKIAAFIDKIKQSFADFIETSGIVEKIESFVNFLSEPKNIRMIIEGMRDFFANAVEFVGKAAYYILEALDIIAFGQIPDSFIDSIKSGSENMASQIRSLGGDLSGIGVSNNQARNEATPTNQTTQPSTGMSGTRLEERPVYIAINPVTGQVIEQKIEGTPYIDLNKLSGK